MSTSLFTAAPALRRAMYTTAQTLFADQDVLVVLGPPAGGDIPDDIVQVQQVETDQETAAMGSSRSREEVLTITVLVSCATGGGPEVDDELTERAYGLLGALEQFCRVTDTTLGGVVRECFLTSARSEGAGPDDVADGRFIDITATFTARNRVRGS